jgi:hypothetical protein
MDWIPAQIIGFCNRLSKEGYRCKKCGKQIINGIGPDNFPVVATILNSLPSSHVLKWAANYHDYLYHKGGDEDARSYADVMFYKLGEWIIKKKVVWYKRWCYSAMNKRNYLFVRMFGKKYFGDDGCSVEKKAG